MSMTDPIADMLTRVRNAQRASKAEVSMPASKVKQAIAAVLKDEGYVSDFKVDREGGKAVLSLRLKYIEGKTVAETADEWAFIAHHTGLVLTDE